jgi:hypothetical protein
VDLFLLFGWNALLHVNALRMNCVCLGLVN